MLDKTATYHKSDKGAEAIATRQGGLSPRQRSMLILVNGRRSFAELAALAQQLGNPEQLLSQLEENGLIETGPPREGPPTEPGALMPMFEPPPPEPARLGPTELRVPLEQAQRFAVERLRDMLGPAGDDLCGTLEATRSPHEFRAAVRRTETVLRSIVGPELAAQFSREVENMRP